MTFVLAAVASGAHEPDPGGAYEAGPSRLALRRIRS